METENVVGVLTEPLISKPSEAEGDTFYDGCITDVSSDGSIDYRGRPADKATFGRWKAVSFIMGALALERMVYYGISANLVSYLTIKLRQGSAEAVTTVWIWGGVAWLLPLVAGFVADSFLGRFYTIMYSFLIYLVGMVFVTMTVTVPGLKPPECPGTSIECEPASTFQVRAFYAALFVVAIGVSGVKPCIASLGADQFEEEDEKERLMKHSYFNLYWWVGTAGAMFSFTVLVYIEDRVGYGWGYGIPTVGLAAAFTVFLLGTRRYRYKLPTGSPLTQVARVLVAAVRNHRFPAPADPSLLHESEHPLRHNLRLTNKLRFLDKAATAAGRTQCSKWELCTATEVEEIKLLTQVMPVWFTTLALSVVVQQTTTFFLRQGISMDQRIIGDFKIVPASLENIIIITSLLLIPIYDRYIVPFVRRFTGNERGFSLLQRLGVGLVITVVSMAVSALVESRRLHVVRTHGLEDSLLPVPMSVFWLIPQYFIMAVAEVFALMGQLEFFYEQVPDNMQTMGTALFTSNIGVAMFLCTGILRVVTSVTSRGGSQPWITSNLNRSRLDKYYWMLTILSAVNFLVFYYVSLGYKYKSTKLPPKQNHNHHDKALTEPLPLD